jgi:FkbM family methyltransferase
LNKQPNWNVNVFDVGLGSEDAELDIQVHGARSTLQMDWYKGENFKLEKVNIRKLEDVLHSNNIETVDFWKLDTEGAELQALLGAKKYLKQGKIKHIYFECHPSNYQEISALLTSCNYCIFDLHGDKLVPKKDEKILETKDLVAMPISA